MQRVVIREEQRSRNPVVQSVPVETPEKAERPIFPETVQFNHAVFDSPARLKRLLHRFKLRLLQGPGVLAGSNDPGSQIRGSRLETE